MDVEKINTLNYDGKWKPNKRNKLSRYIKTSGYKKAYVTFKDDSFDIPKPQKQSTEETATNTTSTDNATTATEESKTNTNNTTTTEKEATSNK